MPASLLKIYSSHAMFKNAIEYMNIIATLSLIFA